MFEIYVYVLCKIPVDDLINSELIIYFFLELCTNCYKIKKCYFYNSNILKIFLL